MNRTVIWSSLNQDIRSQSLRYFKMVTMLLQTLKIVDILEISELTGVFTVKIAYTRVWFDRRLTDKHLKQDSSLNMFSTNESEAVWTPRVVYNNVKDNEKVKHTRVETVHKVVANEDFEFTSLNNMHQKIHRV